MVMVRRGQTRIDLFHEDVPEQGRVRFHCRFESDVYDCYRRHRRHISRAIRAALRKFRTAVNGGMIDLSRMSRFLSRKDVRDKVEIAIRLTVGDKDMLEKMAFALRISQAEVLRMALEWNMEAVNIKAPRHVFYAARRKWHHKRPKLYMRTMRYSFLETGRVLEWQLPSAESIKSACQVISDPENARFSRRYIWQYRSDG